MAETRDVVLKCPACGELCTAKVSPYMREKSAPCPACGKDVPITAFADTPTPPGLPVPQQPNVTTAPVRKTCGMAVAGMILGIVSIVPGLMCCGPVWALVGIYCSWQALQRINRQPLELDGKGMAIAGLTTAIIGLLFGLMALAIMTVFGAVMKASLETLLKMMPQAMPMK